MLGDGADAGAVAQLERDHELAPLTDFRAMAATLSRYFVLWAVVRGLDRRRVFKFAYDEPFSQRPGLTPTYFYDAPGCTEAWSYHVEVAVPQDLKARTTHLVDEATGAVLATGARDADRPALYYSADPAHPPLLPQVVVGYGAERGRFLGPAAIVATRHRPARGAAVAVRRPAGAGGQRRPGDRPRALDLGGVLGARAADRRAPRCCGGCWSATG